MILKCPIRFVIFKVLGQSCGEAMGFYKYQIHLGSILQGRIFCKFGLSFDESPVWPPDPASQTERTSQTCDKPPAGAAIPA